MGNGLTEIGIWSYAGDMTGARTDGEAAFDDSDLHAAIGHFRSPAYIIREPNGGRVGVGLDGHFQSLGANGAAASNGDSYPCLGILPALYPEWLGDRSFLEVHGLRFAYVAGAMARGIASEAVVIEMAKAGMLSFFGAGGLTLDRVEQALITFEQELGDRYSWGCNLIHSPQDPELERALVDLLLRRGVRRISASAFMALTASVVRYAFSGVSRDAAGVIQRPNHVFAKISRPEVARHFMSPPPAEILDGLVNAGLLTSDEATLARELPVAEDYTVESDSGGHTDNRPLGSLFPTIAQTRDEVAAEYGYTRPLRLGAAGGLGTPDAVAAAFGLGAAFVVTGSVNQSCVEAGVSAEAKALLAQAELADMTMCPSADMFELGVKVQVLKRGTMFAARADRLYDYYTRYDSLDAIPAPDLARLETQLFRQPVSEVWAGTRKFFEVRNPPDVERAERDPKHKMALVFRSYLGLSSKWPIDGTADRKLDFQLWCGPAMGSFNAWVKGSFLEPVENRTVVQIARNLLEGAAYVTRAHQLRTYGVPVRAEAMSFRPRKLQ